MSKPVTELPKYLKKHLDDLNWPQLLIFEGKHFRSYYLCQDREAVGRACLMELEARLDAGYIQHPGPEDEINGLQEELTQEVAESLPAPYRTQALNVIVENKNKRLAWAEAVRDFENAQKAVQEKDGNLAYMILAARRAYQYEGYEFGHLYIP